MSRLSRITFFFCLLIMTGYSFSYFFFRTYIKTQKSVFRKELSLLAGDAIKVISVDSEKLYVNGNGIEWVDDNKELLINGRYHDIVSVEIRNGRAFIKIICDEKESSLFDRYFSQHKQGKNFLITFLKLFQFVEDNQGTVVNLVLATDRLSENVFAEISFQVKDFQFKSIKPPRLI